MTVMRLRIYRLAALVCAITPCIHALQIPPEPENIAVAVADVIKYHDSGAYEAAIRAVTASAEEYLANRVKVKQPGEKLAAVFDIDETALSNWAIMLDCGFCAYKVEKQFYPPPAHDPAIAPTLHLFNYAQSLGVAVLFLTGRKENERQRTVDNLTEAGYRDWTQLIMRPVANDDPASVFKPQARQQIVNQGYTIVLNIGDQASDLNGCCAERTFKLPDPFYIVP